MFLQTPRFYLAFLLTWVFALGLRAAPLHLTLVPRMTLTLAENEDFRSSNGTLWIGRTRTDSKFRLLLKFDLSSLRKTVESHLQLGHDSYVSHADLVLQCLTFTRGAPRSRSWRSEPNVKGHLDLLLSRVLKPWRNANWKFTGIDQKWKIPYLDMLGDDATYPIAR